MKRFGTKFFIGSFKLRALALTSLVVVSLLSAELLIAQKGATAIVFSEQQIEALKTARAALSIPTTAPEPESVEVLMPISDIEKGTELHPAMFMPQSVDKRYVPADAVLREELTSVLSKIAVRKLPANSFVLRNDFVVTFDELPFVIPVGYRAVTITVDSQKSIEGYARPGAFVDVNFIYEDTNGDKLIRTIVHSAKVVSLAGGTDPTEVVPTRGSFPITLVVPERDAKAIELAPSVGQLSLSLLGAPSSDPAPDTISTFALLRGESEPVSEEQNYTPITKVVRKDVAGIEKVLITNRAENITPQS